MPVDVATARAPRVVDRNDLLLAVAQRPSACTCGFCDGALHFAKAVDRPAVDREQQIALAAGRRRGARPRPRARRPAPGDVSGCALRVALHPLIRQAELACRRQSAARRNSTSSECSGSPVRAPRSDFSSTQLGRHAAVDLHRARARVLGGEARPRARARRRSADRHDAVEVARRIDETRRPRGSLSRNCSVRDSGNTTGVDRGDRGRRASARGCPRQADDRSRLAGHAARACRSVGGA